jgi:16S rRNA (guanine527-N7)-methyltransferase
VTPVNTRSEQHKGQYDFILSRAVTTLPLFVNQTRHLLAPKPKNAIGNGILYLKGGDLTTELQPFKKRVFVTNLTDYFEEPFFETKKLVHLTL